VAGIGEKNNAGLCSSCINAPICCLRQKRGFDAIYCEMFEVSADPIGDNRAGGNEDVTAPVIEPSRFKGLCINCANRETCKMVKPDEGVWHCEEYC